MKVLFTGATGVLGRAAVPKLVEADHDVTGVARSEDDVAWLDSVGARPREVDLFSPESVRASMGGIDAVVHHATSIPPQRAMWKRSAWETNDRLRSDATGLLVDAAIAVGVSRFVQQSITHVYADGGDAWLDETAPIAPGWDVLDSALVAEATVDRFRSRGGVGVTLRLSRLYGPGQASAAYVASVAARRLPIVGDGRNFVSSVHSHDAATATLAALTAPDGTYNVSDDEPVRSAEQVRSLASILGAPEPFQVPTWMARLVAGKASTLLTTSHRISNAAFKRATGWEPKFPSAIEGWRDILRGREGN